jgi:DNA-binding NtrC family response regulator
MPRVWEMVHSLFTCGASGRVMLPPRVPVVALVVNEQDRHVLASVFGEEPLDMRFAESCDEACSVANQLMAPIILLDRDWPEIEWRAAVERLTASPRKACVILLSGVSDAYLWQELTRRGGYDVLPKPLQADRVERTVKLALSFWSSAPKRAVGPGGLRK